MRVCYHDKVRHTGALLEAALSDVRSDWVLNWGYTSAPTESPLRSGARVINPPAAIAKTSNKERMRQNFLLHNIPTPRVFGPSEARCVVSEDYPLIGRRAVHTRGLGLWICRTPEDVASAARNRRYPDRAATHFMEIVSRPELREYRVHIIGGESVKISEKVHVSTGTEQPGEGVEFGVDGVPIRSTKYGWVYIVPRTRRRKELRAVAKRAVAAQGLHIGAVDVLQDHATKMTWVLEVNAAPGMDDEASTLRRYVAAIEKHWGRGS